jgi:DNA-binding NarL/FixJ family response regulator
MPSVVTGQFEDLVSVALDVLIGEDADLDLVARGVPMDEIEAALRRYQPDVVVLNFEALSSLSDVFRLHQAHSDTRIVVLANRPTSSACTQLLSFGAIGCLSKETDAKDIVRAIHLASDGTHVLPRSAAVGGSLGLRGAELTARESEVSELLKDGCTNSEIAERLSIGIETVRTHARSIYRKLGVPSRRELARVAHQEAVVVDRDRRPVAR